MLTRMPPPVCVYGMRHSFRKTFRNGRAGGNSNYDVIIVRPPLASVQPKKVSSRTTTTPKVPKKKTVEAAPKVNPVLKAAIDAALASQGSATYSGRFGNDILGKAVRAVFLRRSRAFCFWHNYVLKVAH